MNQGGGKKKENASALTREGGRERISSTSNGTRWRKKASLPRKIGRRVLERKKKRNWWGGKIEKPGKKEALLHPLRERGWKELISSEREGSRSMFAWEGEEDYSLGESREKKRK